MAGEATRDLPPVIITTAVAIRNVGKLAAASARTANAAAGTAVAAGLAIVASNYNGQCLAAEQSKPVCELTE